MIALGIDTSTASASVGLAGGAGLLAELNLCGVAAHSSRLLGVVRGLLEAAGIGTDRIDVLAVAAGPGSFTGLRVGMATAKGIALATGGPLVGFSTLETMAITCAVGLGRPGASAVCVLLDAGRGEVYRGLYRVENGGAFPLAPEAALSPEAAVTGIPEGSLVCGEGLRSYRERIGPRLPAGTRLSEATPFIGGTLARRAIDAAGAWGPGPPPRLVPNYLRPADAELNPRG